MFAKDDLIAPQEEAILEESSNFNKCCAQNRGQCWSGAGSDFFAKALYR
jgi:hypothetical protein